MTMYNYLVLEILNLLFHIVSIFVQCFTHYINALINFNFHVINLNRPDILLTRIIYIKLSIPYYILSRLLFVILKEECLIACRVLKLTVYQSISSKKKKKNDIIANLKKIILSTVKYCCYNENKIYFVFILSDFLKNSNCTILILQLYLYRQYD
jgi:hypothetical protein